ncbi:MAG: Rne/Rng family ribonuclease [Bacillaceae bacterium]|nr:Rne/Rng family ribonuclease [Bacillaceae bacterium]
MLNQIIVNCKNRETRVAVTEKGRLVELFIERPAEKRVVGNVYKGRVADVVPGMQAAFVDIGIDKNAFLYVDDCFPGGSRPADRIKIQEVLKEGQEILVQVTKEPLGTKGARVTTHITLPGRFMVYVPGHEEIGVSRRIVNEQERERLRDLAQSLCNPGEGIIIRTAAEGIAEEELREDLESLRARWHNVSERARIITAPASVYEDLTLVPRIIRDLFRDDIDEIIIDSRRDYHQVLEALKTSIPGLESKMKLHRDNKSIFDAYQIEHEIEKALRPKVWLKSGGYIVINQTEALASIDVNTGKYTGGHDLEETVLKTNLEAAAEIARQLRLRDIGGIVIIDFIDMQQENNRELVIKELEAQLKKDRTKSHILGITRLGLVEMTRKKVRRNLREVLTVSCPCCAGEGRIRSESETAGRVEREIREYAGSDVEAVLVEVHPRTASVLIGNNGHELKRIEQITGLTLYVKTNDDLAFHDYRIAYAGSEQEARRLALPVKEGEILSLTVEEKHAQKPGDGIARLEGFVIQIAGAGHQVGNRVLVKIDHVYPTSATASIFPLTG